MVVQDPGDAQYDGMPRSAVATGIVDYVLPLKDIPQAVVRHVRHMHFRSAAPPDALAREQPDDLQAILPDAAAGPWPFRLSLLQEGHAGAADSASYGSAATRLDEGVLDLLRENREEVTALTKDLLIGVTGFFREPEAFEALDSEVIAKLVGAKGPDAPLRAWVPRCTTGEEAYSIAILLSERLSAAQRACPVQVFATDIDEGALSVGRSGIYPENIAADIRPQRLQRFFTQQNQHYRVNKSIRESVLFAVQDVAGDPPFSNMDLISCRNLLIYLEPEVQGKVLALFHFALNEGGYLFLGGAESVGRHEELFRPLSKKWRIFRRLGGPRSVVELPILPAGSGRGPSARGWPNSHTGSFSKTSPRPRSWSTPSCRCATSTAPWSVTCAGRAAR